MEHNNDAEVILNTQEVTEEPNTPESDESSEESTIDWRAEALKAKELADNYKIRAEKAERKTKEAPVVKTQESNGNLSPIDIFALTKANIEAEDLEEVLDYAKYKGISVAEAIKSPVVKATLAERAEQRNVALATNTGASKRTTARQSDEALVSKAEKGELPESDADIARLVAAKYGKK